MLPFSIFSSQSDVYASSQPDVRAGWPKRSSYRGASSVGPAFASNLLDILCGFPGLY
jgi:hypothetical protein